MSAFSKAPALSLLLLGAVGVSARTVAEIIKASEDLQAPVRAANRRRLDAVRAENLRRLNEVLRKSWDTMPQCFKCSDDGQPQEKVAIYLTRQKGGLIALGRFDQRGLEWPIGLEQPQSYDMYFHGQCAEDLRHVYTEGNARSLEVTAFSYEYQDREIRTDYPAIRKLTDATVCFGCNKVCAAENGTWSYLVLQKSVLAGIGSEIPVDTRFWYCKKCLSINVDILYPHAEDFHQNVATVAGRMDWRYYSKVQSHVGFEPKRRRRLGSKTLAQRLRDLERR